MKRGGQLIRRVRSLPLARFQLLAAEAIFLFYFLSVARYKTWYVGTMFALVLSAFLVAIPALKIRGLALDVSPLAAYYVYLYIAASWSQYGGEARWWAAVDSIGIAVFIVFWIAARNNPAGVVIESFVRVPLLMAVVLYLMYDQTGTATRFGGYTLSYIPAALPFIWTALVRRTRRLATTGALVICLSVLLLSRSRSPLFAGVIVLGLAMLLIGHSLRQRIKWAMVAFIVVAALGAIMYAMQPTRYILLSFAARITGKDVLTTEFYIPGEPRDPVRENLNSLVRDNIMQVQPFGAGYMVTQRLFERAYTDPYSLHSIYETWAFEGGIFCVVIVAVMFLRHLRGLSFARRFATTQDEVLLARCLHLGLLATLLMGLFHQMHQGPVLYSLFGLALGLRARVKSERRSAVPAAQPVRRPATASAPLPA